MMITLNTKIGERTKPLISDSLYYKIDETLEGNSCNTGIIDSVWTMLAILQILIREIHEKTIRN